MIQRNKYIIYLDTQVKGALYQTLRYFKQGVFNKDTSLVYKRYRKIDRLFQKELEKHNINYVSFKKYKEIPCINNKIVFYLFNAQSNCRIVANRNAKHIFVTHGESNKVSSIKPMLRIYDYVITAGDLGIDRYLQNNIFYQEDITRNRVIKMGNTFIGNAKYTYNKSSNSILYAPTWEGGVIEENYSSLSKDQYSFKIIENFVKSNNIKTIYIQPHPNTGHRDKQFLTYLTNGIKYLATINNVSIIIVGFDFDLLFKIKLKFHKNIDISFKNSLAFNIAQAFVDISAMEIQLLDKNIPSYVFCTKNDKQIVFNHLLMDHYKNVGILRFQKKEISFLEVNKEFQNYAISYQENSLAILPMCDRINWLKTYIKA